MSKPRIIIPIVVQFAVRYAIRTGLLEQLKDYLQPVILLRWQDQELTEELHQAGVEIYHLPETECSVEYTRIKRQLDMWHLKRLQSPTTAIDARRVGQLAPPTARAQFRDIFYKLNLALPGSPARLLAKIQNALLQYTNVRVFDKQLSDIGAEAVLSLTPYFQQEQLLLFAAKQQGLPLCTSIISFDNITTRGWIPVTFDAYFLWNSYNEIELRRAYPEAEAAHVEIVGAPQFDFYWNSSYLWEEDRWRDQLSLPANRPVILFGAGHHLIVPHESHWLQQLDDAIESSKIPGQPVILFRRHPNDPIDRWLPVLRRTKHVIYDEPWVLGKVNPALTNIRREDIERLTSTLAHSQVHVNASSTMTVDGAIFDRPQIGPAYDDRPGQPHDRLTKELYQREHYLPITRSGGLEIANSLDEMITSVCSGFNAPDDKSDGRKRIVQEICTFDDGRCTERLKQALMSFLANRGLLPKFTTEHSRVELPY